MPELDSTRPHTAVTVQYLVNLTEPLGRWSVTIATHTTQGDGATVEVGSLRREFGPFDDQVSVAQWLCQQVHAHTKAQVVTATSPPNESPQGRRLPESE